MMKKLCWAAAAVSLFVSLGAVTSVQAQETGVAGIHQWVTVGRKTCLASHFHDGSGTGKTQKEAEKAAILSWEAFTAWEYGASWGRYALSESKKMTCDRQTTSEFKCNVTSRACIAKSTRPAKKRTKKQ
jgi:hypothetical protein